MTFFVKNPCNNQEKHTFFTYTFLLEKKNSQRKTPEKIKIKNYVNLIVVRLWVKRDSGTGVFL